jgi:CRP-like cAMP-binding protein/rhodanese-related sulfurtransferase
MTKELNISQLKVFSPLAGLKKDNLHALLKKTSLQEAAEGEQLFKEGDTEKRTIYVLSGSVDLKEADQTVATIVGGTDDARKPIAPSIPRNQTALAAGAVEYISIDSDLLDVMLTWDQTGTYEVGDFNDEPRTDNDDWMTTLLQTKAFHKIPPANIQAFFMRLQQVDYTAGDTVIKQGDPGDYFYIITRGQCAVTRETPLKKDGIKLAELEVGNSFGEEALISEANRNATVTMETDGTLMRLGNADFQTLLNEPMLEWLEPDDAERAVAAGARWLDVRLPTEFEVSHKDGAVNVPLYFLRMKLNSLDLETKYVIYCDTGRRSSAAAFILNERNFQAVVLKGGLNGSKPDEN